MAGRSAQIYLLTQATKEYSAAAVAAGAAQANLDRERAVSLLIAKGLAQEEANLAVTTAYATTAQNAATSSTARLTATMQGLKTAMLTNPLFIGLAIATAVYATVKAVDYFTVSLEEAKEAAIDSVEEFNNLKSEAESLNSELETTASRIKELEGKNKLTFVEQEELENLKDANEQLKQQYETTKALLSLQNEESRKKSLDIFNHNGAYERYVGFDMSGVENGNQMYGNAVSETITGTPVEIARRQMEDYKKLVEDKSALEQNMANFKAANFDTYEKSNEYKNMELEFNALDNAITGLKTSLSGSIAEFDALDDVLDMDNDKELIDSLNEIRDKFSELFGGGKSSAQKFDELWNSMSFARYKEQLEELANKGELTPDVLRSNENYRKLLEATGKTANETAENIYAILESANESKNYGSGISATISKIETLSSGFDKLDSIMTDVANKKMFDYSSLVDEDFVNIFGKYEAEYRNFVEIVSASPSDIQACQSAFDELVNTWLISSNVLYDLNEENAALVTQMLEEKGIANASAIVNNQLATARKYAAMSAELHGENLYEEIKKLADEDGQIEDNELSLIQYAIAKETANGTVLNTDGDITNLIALVEALGGASKALKNFQDMKLHISEMVAGGRYDKLPEDSKAAIETGLKKTEAEALAEVRGALNKTTTGAQYTGASKTKSSDKGGSKGKYWDTWQEQLNDKEKAIQALIGRDEDLNRQYEEAVRTNNEALAESLYKQIIENKGAIQSAYAENAAEVRNILQGEVLPVLLQIAPQLNEAPIDEWFDEVIYEKYLEKLNDSFYGVRYNRSSAKEKEFLFVMVKCKKFPCTMNDVAKKMGKSQKSISPQRANFD